MTVPIPSRWLSVLAAAAAATLASFVAAQPDGAQPPPDAAPRPSLFSNSNLVAWCVVPFDSEDRTPEERAAMLERLGLTRLAYDWRERHVPTFEREIVALKKRGIELFAFWKGHEEAYRLFEKHGVRPQIWRTAPSPKRGSDDERMAAATAALLPLAKRTQALGCRLGLYNHGGWGGRPANLIAVCRRLREQTGSDHVGIVYNLHHAHGDLADFERSLAALRPYLLCLNLNGTNTRPQPKILELGKGEHDARLVAAIARSGYRGPIGILDHRADVDAERALSANLAGLRTLTATLTREPKPVVHLDADRAAKMIDARRDLLVLDVRTPREYDTGRILGARNVDFRAADFRARLAEIDRGKPVLVHCAVGGRSTSALKTLAALGFREVYHLDGGIKAWSAAGHPLVLD